MELTRDEQRVIELKSLDRADDERKQAKHTATPWNWDGKVWDYDKELEAPWLVNTDGAIPILTGEITCALEANAAFIVRAVNSHEELLEALISARAFIPTSQPTLRSTVNAAIAKAEGR